MTIFNKKEYNEMCNEAEFPFQKLTDAKIDDLMITGARLLYEQYTEQCNELFKNFDDLGYQSKSHNEIALLSLPSILDTCSCNNKSEILYEYTKAILASIKYLELRGGA